MSDSISPLAPKKYAKLAPIAGVRLETAQAGIKYKNRTDVFLMVFDKPAQVAGVFTRSKCPSAPVDHCRKSLANGVARAVVVIPAMQTLSRQEGHCNNGRDCASGRQGYRLQSG